MPRVRALSNHPYRGRMQVKGTEYEAADADLDLLITLGRVAPVEVSDDGRTYATRELQASVPPAPSTRAKRRAREPNAATAALPSSDED
jgi:hypothetical protein